MPGEIESVGTAVEGALIGAAVEGAQMPGREGGGDACLNCGAPIDTPYCAQCGQPRHIHRTLSAIWHDFLHSVLHFDGKLWATLPLLAWKPGDLTRRYIDGERAKFVSPMALFLFAIFLMFAVFSIIGGPSVGSRPAGEAGQDFKTEVAKGKAEIEADMGRLKAELRRPGLSPERKAAIEAELKNLKLGSNVMASMEGSAAPYPEAPLDGAIAEGDIDTGNKRLDSWLLKLGRKANANPGLLLYKLQSNGYKFAWLLVPMSLPFVWLSTLGVRGRRFFDHAVFTTYSIAFMCFLFIALALASAAGVPQGLTSTGFVFAPPIHMYRHLRGTYGLSRAGALLRLIPLFSSVLLVLAAFMLILLALGLLG